MFDVFVCCAASGSIVLSLYGMNEMALMLATVGLVVTFVWSLGEYLEEK